MLQILTITLPIYLIIGLGYLSVRSRLFEREHMAVIGRFILMISMPPLVFRAISQHPLEEVVNVVYLAAYLTASLLVHLGGYACARLLYGHPRPRAALIGMGMGVSNSLFIGYPIIQQVVGPSASIALALCLLVENLIMAPLTMLIADTREDLPWRRALCNSLLTQLKSPLFLGILAGFACSAAAFTMPGPLDKAVQMIGGVSAPLALFMIGGVLVGSELKGSGRDIATIVLGKLLLHPIVTLLVLVMFPPLDPALQTAAFLFACMPLPSIFPAIAFRYGETAVCAAALVTATVLSFLTLNGWLLLLPGLSARFWG